MFDTSEEANQKLRHSVVLLAQEPVFIQISEGAKKNVVLHYSDLGASEVKKKNIWDSDWNFRNLGPYLGYCNFEFGEKRHNEAVYLSRMPVRQCSSTQGVSQRNLHIPSLKGSPRLGLVGIQLTWQSIYNTKPFINMFKNQYPEMNDIKKAFEKSPWVTSRAFNKEFSVRRADVGPFYLQYKNKDVGHSDDLYRWKVAPQFEYLRETMDYIDLKIA